MSRASKLAVKHRLDSSSKARSIDNRDPGSPGRRSQSPCYGNQMLGIFDTPSARSQDELVTSLLSLQGETPDRQPDQRIGPVESADEPDHQCGHMIVASEMTELVEQDELEPIGGPGLRLHGEQYDRFERRSNHRHRYAIGEPHIQRIRRTETLSAPIGHLRHQRRQELAGGRDPAQSPEVEQGSSAHEQKSRRP